MRVTNFAGAAFELELFAYGNTSDWAELTAIRQDVILKIAGIVEAAGTRFAAPTRLTYQSKDPGVDADRASDIVRQVTELRADNAFRFPGEVQTAQSWNAIGGAFEASLRDEIMYIPVTAFLRERKPRFFEGLDPH